jgi:raffinose/stachyose/melibiose transport system substrate-binding protein
MTRKLSVILSLVLVCVFAISSAALAADKVTIRWWHIFTEESQKAVCQKFADDYMAANPNVTIEVTVMENEAFKTKLTTVMQGGNPPDIFHSWGGGVLNDYAKAGLLRDITADLDKDGWRDLYGAGALETYAAGGKNYGIPNDMGMIGFWYNTELFEKAGIKAVPTTWSEFLADVKLLKDSGTIPIAVASQDKWPAMYYWTYLASRIGGKAAFDAAYNRTGSFTDPVFIEAGYKLKELIDMEPFQDGFLGSIYNDQGGLVGNGKAAMELMGQWAPTVQADNSIDKKGLGDKLGWFPFPSVEGGAGSVADAMGGGGGFIVGKDAPDEAVDFLKYINTVEAQATMAKAGMVIPCAKGAEVGLTDPFKLQIKAAVDNAPYFQLYYDQFLPSATAQVINDSIQGLFAGTMTPEEVAQAIEDSAAEELG